jgi:hypothetical protein
VSTPCDDIPAEVRRASHGWFGEPWWSYECYDESGRLREDMRKPSAPQRRCG